MILPVENWGSACVWETGFIRITRVRITDYGHGNVV